jgi:hypothetical protein
VAASAVWSKQAQLVLVMQAQLFFGIVSGAAQSSKQQLAASAL